MSDEGGGLKLPVTRAWYRRFREAVDELPQGEKQRLAEYAGCSSSFISRLIADEPESSEHLGRISEYLKIPPPMVEVHSEAQVRLMKISSDLSPEAIEALIANANLMKR